jgi:site-specific recombinase XerC
LRPWALSLLRRFHADARHNGYSGDAAYDKARALMHLVLHASDATNTATFSDTFVETVRAKLRNRRRASNVDKDLLRFLTRRRLVGRFDWDGLRVVGRMEALLAELPDQLRADLNLYRSHLDDERRYRKSTGERCRLLRTQTYVVTYGLVPFARFLAAEGHTSWQELTPDRMRTAFHRLGGDPRHLANALAPLKRFFSFLASGRRMFRNPLRAMQATSTTAPLYWPLPDLAFLLKTVADAQADPILRVVAALVGFHGLRSADVGALRVVDFKRRARELVLRRRRRSIALDPLTFEALVAYLRVRRPAKSNPHLVVSLYSQKSGAAVQLGPYLKRLGLSGLGARQALLHQALERESPIIAATLFDLSIGQINRHLRLVYALKTDELHTVKR